MIDAYEFKLVEIYEILSSSFKCTYYEEGWRFVQIVQESRIENIPTEAHSQVQSYTDVHGNYVTPPGKTTNQNIPVNNFDCKALLVKSRAHSVLYKKDV